MVDRDLSLQPMNDHRECPEERAGKIYLEGTSGLSFARLIDRLFLFREGVIGRRMTFLVID
eukprot:scaffold22680_cov107-Cylindrotheca_fusiformis.AAC.6